MKDLLFLLADGWMIFAGLYCGWQFLRRYRNWLLGLEWMIIGISGVNYLAWALLNADTPIDQAASNAHAMSVYFFDSFTRAVGITLILVLGVMRVTHRYKPSALADVAAFGLATAAGLYLMQFGGWQFREALDLPVGPATLFVVVNVLTSLFLAYFAWRLWAIDARGLAALTGLATVAGFVIALTYDFDVFGFSSFDDEHHTIFAIAALTTWGTQLFVYYHAYRALHDHNVAMGLEPAPDELGIARKGAVA